MVESGCSCFVLVRQNPRVKILDSPVISPRSIPEHPHDASSQMRGTPSPCPLALSLIVIPAKAGIQLAAT
jgi:hypothetical protein